MVGNPAKVIKLLEKGKCIPFKSIYEYHGYIPAAKFNEFRKRHLHVC